MISLNRCEGIFLEILLMQYPQVEAAKAMCWRLALYTEPYSVNLDRSLCIYGGIAVGIFLGKK